MEHSLHPGSSCAASSQSQRQQTTTTRRINVKRETSRVWVIRYSSSSSKHVFSVLLLLLPLLLLVLCGIGPRKIVDGMTLSSRKLPCFVSAFPLRSNDRRGWQQQYQQIRSSSSSLPLIFSPVSSFAIDNSEKRLQPRRKFASILRTRRRISQELFSSPGADLSDFIHHPSDTVESERRTSAARPGVVVGMPIKQAATGSGTKIEEADEKIPTSLSEAFHVFFLGKYHGPRLVVVVLTVLSSCRWNLGAVTAGPSHHHMLDAVGDVTVFMGMMVFWWFQENILHDQFLHSDWNWYGKTVHAQHHAKPYYHVSIDPAVLILGWLVTVGCIFGLVFPLPLALSATMGYALAGLLYEWSHFIVHTRVLFPVDKENDNDKTATPSSSTSLATQDNNNNIRLLHWVRRGWNSYMRTIRDHHMRHHLVDDRFWFGFSCVPFIDDIFQTNPTVQNVRRLHKKIANDEKSNDKQQQEQQSR